VNPRDASNRGRGEGDPRPESSAPAADPDAHLVRAVVRAVRGGDHEAFGRLVERYQGRLFALALMLTREPSAAEEVTQDALVRAFTSLDAYDEGRPFYPWLATIAVRLAQNWLHRRGRVAMREGQAPAPDLETAAGADALAALIADEDGRRLWRSVALLPQGERAAVILYYRQDMSVRDIARALGVTSGTVKTFLFRARQKLRRTLRAAQQKGEGR